MPGRLFLSRDGDALAKAFAAPRPVFSVPARFNIAPGQQVVTCLPDRTLALVRWGLIPVGRVNARGRPVLDTIVNARSESVFSKSAFAGVGRCIVPADGWYEWTGEKRRKTAWRLSRADGGILFFAAIYDVWQAPGGGASLMQLATLTCAPNPDVADIHDRMGVILSPNDFDSWLGDGSCQTARLETLMKPPPAGTIRVEPATAVDWDAP